MRVCVRALSMDFYEPTHFIALIAPSMISDGQGAHFLFQTVLGVDIQEHFRLFPNCLDPEPAQSDEIRAHLAVPWSPGFVEIASMCKTGASVENCARSFNASSPLDIHTGVPPFNYTHFHEIYSIVPVFRSGFALLGELEKFVRVSPVRFPELRSDANGIVATINCASEELLKITLGVPDISGEPASLVQSLNATCPSSKTLSLKCTRTPRGSQPCCQLVPIPASLEKESQLR